MKLPGSRPSAAGGCCALLGTGPGKAHKMVSFFLSDEELGKKDDDHKPTKLPPVRSSFWNPSRVPPRKTLRRLAIALAACFLVYIFVANIPTDVPIRDHRHPTYTYPGSAPAKAKSSDSQTEAKISLPVLQLHPKEASPAPEAKLVTATPYNGPVKFLDLAETLHAISGTRGGFAVNRNVLFAAANLKSAATLLPIACQMGAELRSYVHFALLGGTDLQLEEIRAVNGIDDSCQILYHGAQPPRTYSRHPGLTVYRWSARFRINLFREPPQA
jgi:hypothetical protein